MLEHRTKLFGRSGKICGDTLQKSFLEWTYAKFEVENPAKGRCGSGQWSAARETANKSASKLDEEDVELRWGGRNQKGAGNTIGEEVEQVNSFLSRAAICSKYMSKA
ncbi:hypothetical protein NQZ68_034218, partial [Dissostichus eleginoides]